jgi:hypothetical protein
MTKPLLDYLDISDNDRLIIQPLSWTKCDEVLKALHINSNSLNEKSYEQAVEDGDISGTKTSIDGSTRLSGAFYGSRSSFSRALSKFERLHKDFFIRFATKGNESRFKDFLLGDSTKVSTKESSRFSFFIFDLLLRRIDRNFGLTIDPNTFDPLFTKSDHVGAELKWNDKKITAYYRSYPYVDFKDYDVGFDCPAYSLMNNTMEGIPGENRVFTFGIEVRKDAVILKIYKCDCELAQEHFDKNAILEHIKDESNWPGYAFLIRNDGSFSAEPILTGKELKRAYVPSILRHTFDESRDYHRFRNPSVEEEYLEEMNPNDEDYEYAFSDEAEEDAQSSLKPQDVLPSREVNEYQILEFFERLNDKQIGFLQRLINLKKK